MLLSFLEKEGPCFFGDISRRILLSVTLISTFTFIISFLLLSLISGFLVSLLRFRLLIWIFLSVSPVLAVSSKFLCFVSVFIHLNIFSDFFF